MPNRQEDTRRRPVERVLCRGQIHKLLLVIALLHVIRRASISINQLDRLLISCTKTFETQDWPLVVSSPFFLVRSSIVERVLCVCFRCCGGFIEFIILLRTGLDESSVQLRPTVEVTQCGNSEVALLRSYM